MDRTRILQRPASRDASIEKTEIIPRVSNTASVPYEVADTFSTASGAPARLVSVGDCVKGRFDLLEVLGVGGMGVVFHARDRRQIELGEQEPFLALKVLNDRLQNNDAALIALQRECRKSQRLAHPNIVNVFDFDRDENVAFLTMELLKGESLDSRLYQPGFAGESLQAIAGHLRDIAAALEYAHEKGVIHSDFKPSNLFLTDEGTIKIFDFGIARIMQSLEGKSVFSEDHESNQELSALTPAFASLGMLTDEPPDVSDDLYAFAVVIYYWLTGSHPYSRKTALEVKDSKLVPLRPQGLEEECWKVLRLALDPVNGSHLSVREFIVRFLPDKKPLNTFAKLSLAVLIVALVVVGGGWLFRALSDAQLARALGSDDEAVVEHTLMRIEGLSAEHRQSVLLENREVLIRHALGRINTLIEKGHFFEANQYLAKYLSLYPDSQQLFEKQTAVHSKTERQAARLAVKLSDMEARLLALSASDVALWSHHLEQLQLTEPSHELLERERIQKMLSPLIHSQLLKGNVAAALTLLQHPRIKALNTPESSRLQALVERYLSLETPVLKRAQPVAHVSGEQLFSAEEMLRLAGEDGLNEAEIEALLDGIEAKRPAFAAAFRWAMQAQYGLHQE